MSTRDNPDLAYWMQTHTGRAFPFDNGITGMAAAMHWHDMAVALGRIPRFMGHSTHEAWSVAQHCTVMSYLVHPRLALHAHVHDAREAYVGDLPSPLRRYLTHIYRYDVGDSRGSLTKSKGPYEELEGDVGLAVEMHFQITPSRDDYAAIRHSDLRMLATEKLLFLAPEPRPWVELPPPFTIDDLPSRERYTWAHMWRPWRPQQAIYEWAFRLFKLIPHHFNLSRAELNQLLIDGCH